MTAGVDTTFDYRSDTPPGQDPDRYSQTLRRHHQLLWSKELPGGDHFELAPEPKSYLAHRSHLGEFRLSSDAITTRLQKRAARVITTIPKGEIPQYLGYTAGSALVFPGIQIDRKQTINVARGFNRKIADRIDLTLECIRRHYSGELPNPLADVLNRYREFFALFKTFDGYVKFFLLQDLLEDDGVTIKYFHPFRDFATPAVPNNKDEYLEYLRRKNNFISARNATIDTQP